MFSNYWNSKHSDLVIAIYYTLPVPTSLIFCHYSLYLFITHTSKQTNTFSQPDSFHSDTETLSYYNWHIWGNTTLQYRNQGLFLFHILLRLTNLTEVCVCVYPCMYWLRLMEELTNTMQLLFSSGDEQSGNDFRCPERFYSAGIQPDSYTQSTLY